MMHTISKSLLERLFSDGYSNNELTEKTLLSVLLKIITNLFQR